MSEDREFRVRPGKAKRSKAQGRNARGLVAEVLRVAALSGGGKRAGWGGSRGRGQSSFGKGRTAFARRSEEHTSELQSLMRISYAVFCLKKKKKPAKKNE